MLLLCVLPLGHGLCCILYHPRTHTHCLSISLSSPPSCDCTCTCDVRMRVGVLLQQSEVAEAAAMCAAAGAWLVLDNTYEDFVYKGRSHHCMSGPNILNVFSFSKAYGMMG